MKYQIIFSTIIFRYLSKVINSHFVSVTYNILNKFLLHKLFRNLYIMEEISKIVFREPNIEDATHIHALINDSPPLDLNSLYFYLIQSHHFYETSIVAVFESQLLGFVSSHFIPNMNQNTLFIWQVAVDKNSRKKGLATEMIKSILNRSICKNIRYIETSVTEANLNSKQLFQGIASILDCPIKESKLFDKKLHFKGKHDSEILLKIGPIKKI